jgi:hypothetical protein
VTSVGNWEPDAEGVAIDATLVERLLRAASRLDDATVGLQGEEIVRLAGLMRRPRETWQPVAATLDDGQLEALIRFFTLAEERLPGWEGGAQSPVIALAAELRRRGAYPKALTAWIRRSSRNRFLPWGSLADRL